MFTETHTHTYSCRLKQGGRTRTQRRHVRLAARSSFYIHIAVSYRSVFRSTYISIYIYVYIYIYIYIYTYKYVYIYMYIYIG